MNTYTITKEHVVNLKYIGPWDLSNVDGRVTTDINQFPACLQVREFPINQFPACLQVREFPGERR